MADITSGLIGYWKFDEGSGTSASDSSGNAYTGTLTNTPTWVAGQINSGLNFVAASSQYVDVTGLTNDALFIGASNVTFTTTAWFKLNNGYATSAFIIAKGQSGAGSPNNGGWAAAVSSTGANMVFKDGSGANPLVRATATTSLNDGLWHHYVAVVTANTTSSTGQDIQLYLDGKLDQGTLTNTGPCAAGVPAPPVTIGRRQTAAGLFWDGVIDDVHLYNRALSAGDIQQLYLKNAFQLNNYQHVSAGNGMSCTEKIR